MQINRGSFILPAYKLSEIISPKRVKDIASYVRYISNVALLLGPDIDNNDDIIDDNDKVNGKTRNETLEMAFEIVKFESDLAKVRHQIYLIINHYY